MSTSIYVNGLDMLALCGLHISDPARGPFSAPDRADDTLNIPSLPGALLTTIPPAVGPRPIELQGAVVATSLTALNTQLDTLREILDGGLLEVKFAHDTTRLIRCRCTGVQVSYAAPAFRTAGQKVAVVTISLRADDPWFYSTTPTVISFGSTAVAIPLGTAPSVGRDNWSALIEIVGAATTPTLTYANFRAQSIGTMVFSGYSPLAGDSILIDLGRRLVWKRVSGTLTNAISYLTAGYTFPALSPDDAYVAGSLYPTLKVSAGSASIRYWKAWK